MSQFQMDCPHCGTLKTAVTARMAFATTSRKISAFVTCNTCHEGIAVYGKTTDALSNIYVRDVLLKMGSNWANVIENMEWTGCAPEFPKPTTIAHLPPQVSSAFNEAEANFADRRHASAAMGYRRSIERALKVLNPGTTGMLNGRIRALEKENALPHALIQLLDSVKFLGNDSAHEMDDPEPEDVATGRDFTTLLLTYLFDLPERVKLAAARRDSAKPGHE